MPAWPEDRPFLVVSASGRALAASAAKRGVTVVVLDLFNDLDTRASSLASRAVAGRGGGFDARKLIAAANELCPPQACAGLVYGSGLEARTGLLEKLAQGRALYGNRPAIVARLKDPLHFFPLLDALDIAHPDVRLSPPSLPAGWLAKRAGGAGGGHVRRASARHGARVDRYFQRVQEGRALSALFAADGRRARIIGCNEQWTAPAWSARRYLYAGAVSRPSIPPAVDARVRDLIDRLVGATGLTGINGVDFILDGQTPYVLEINPRPTATIDLYDDEIHGGAFLAHLRACLGELPVVQVSMQSRAHAIVYAAGMVRIPPCIDWPDWCTDLPAAGSTIAAGAPVCSVQARAESSEAARTLALSRRDAMRDLLLEKAA
jgi:predicted ATP-grasp superfamily ATP-dependent carboligase